MSSRQKKQKQSLSRTFLIFFCWRGARTCGDRFLITHVFSLGECECGMWVLVLGWWSRKKSESFHQKRNGKSFFQSGVQKERFASLSTNFGRKSWNCLFKVNWPLKAFGCVLTMSIFCLPFAYMVAPLRTSCCSRESLITFKNLHYSGLQNCYKSRCRPASSLLWSFPTLSLVFLMQNWKLGPFSTVTIKGICCFVYLVRRLFF